MGQALKSSEPAADEVWVVEDETMTGSDVTRGYGALEPLTQSSGVQASAKAAAPQAPDVDRTQLSAAGALFAQAAGGSDVRLEKVAALQQAIAGGTYNVSSEAVVDKLISSLTRSR